MPHVPLRRKLVVAGLTAVGLWFFAEARVTALFGAEIRAWEAPLPASKAGHTVLKGNPYLLYEYPPGTYFEQGVTVRINGLGLRGPEVQTPKPAGRRRLLTTGDSSVFGFGVAEGEVFSQVAAEALGPGVEAVSAAIPGYSTFETLNLLRMRALATEPDLFVIANLWSDNNFDAFVDRETLAEYAGWEEGPMGQAQRLLSKSAIFRWLDWELRVESQSRLARTVTWQKDGAAHIGQRRVAIQDYADNLDTLARIAVDRGAELVFVVLANNEDLDAGAIAGPVGRAAWDPYRAVLRDTAARWSSPVIEVPRLFQESGHSKAALFQDEMHPTALGHRLLGQALAQQLAGWAKGDRIGTAASGGEVPDYVDPFVQSSGPPAAPQPSTATSPCRLTGVVQAARWTAGMIRLDAVTGPTGGEGGPVTIVGSASLRGPGPFTLDCGAATTVHLRAYFDEDGDGPDQDDTLVTLEAWPQDLQPGPLSGLKVDLDEPSVSGGAHGR